MAVPVRRSARPRRPYGTIAVLTLLAAGLLWVLVPYSQGEPISGPLAVLNDLFPSVFASEEAPEDEPSGPAEGMVRVFISGRTIPAYTKLVRDDLWNAAKGTWAYTDVEESLIESAGVLVGMSDIVGRVLADQKAPGYVFTESDFLAKGTRPGLSAGVPAGKRALRIAVDTVHGIVGLQPGDRFDMVSALSINAPKAGGAPALSGPYSHILGQQAQAAAPPRAQVRVLVQNGIVVTPLQTRQIPISSASLTSGTTVRTVPKQEMVIALDPEEVAPFMEALSVGAEITCLARSGRPDDPQDSVTPSHEPELSTWTNLLPGGSAALGSANAMTVIESISDKDRALIPVPGAAPPEDPR